ncbi:MAG TPA: DUF4230 domain-containing protein [Candidatus Absconditabacterales bacterium]|nr:DUF4230 domain-containing protein [Candidatus Absconditabacterales bacterium]
MKLLKKLFNIIFIIAIIILAYFVWNLLQKQEIIVTDTTKSVINELKSVNKIESAEMIITKIMEAEKDLIDIIPSISFDNTIQNALFQDKMIFQLEGTVVAGIDLEKLNTGDIRTNLDGSVSIDFPKAEILHVTIDENSKPYDRRIGILTKGNIEMETKIRNKAKEDMKIEAIENGILVSAEKNAINNLTTLLSGINIQVR